MNNKSISIFISGDFAATSRVTDAINVGDYQSLFNDAISVIKESDIAITNLEFPLIDNGLPIAKTGPNCKSPVKSIEAIKFAGFDMVTMANNHMMDYGEEGLLSSIQLCEKNGIRHIGAGNNIVEAKRIVYFDVKEKRIAFINCCENEWSTTYGETSGCNPLDEVSLFYQIQEAKSTADYVILIIHGGHEMYEYPSPRMKKLYRWFVDLGVDAVIGHHTHCYSGNEIYKGKPIVYSLGNFIFDSNRRGSIWNMGCAVVLYLDDNSCDVRFYPYRQCDNEIGVHLLKGEDLNKWQDENKEKTLIIQNDILLEKQLSSFIETKEKDYLDRLEPFTSRIAQWALRKGLLPRFINNLKRRSYLNLIRAESHRDVLLRVLSK